MPSPQKLEANRKLYSSIFLEQAKPYLVDTPRVWAKEFGAVRDFGQSLGMVAKARLIPFSRTKVPTDCRVFHYLPNKLGDAYAVLHFSVFALQPTDYIFILDCNIPRAAFLKKASGSELWDKWATAVTEAGEEDPFATHLSNLERKGKLLPEYPHQYSHWTYHLGKLAVEVPYTMALLPLGDGRTVFLFKRMYRPGIFSVKKSNFDLDIIWRVADWILEALNTFGYQGEPTPLDVAVPAGSLLAVPEIAPLFEDQGKDIPFTVDLSGFNFSRPSTPPQQTQQASVQEYKFCVQCGTKLVKDAAFCSKCGAKQG